MKPVFAFGLIVALVAAAPALGQDKPRLGISIHAEGVMIDEVVRAGAAGKAGFERGDIFVQVGEDRVRGVEDVQAWLATLQGGESAAVKVLRGAGERTLQVQFPAELGEGAKLGVVAGTGLLVVSVDEDSVAERAGLKVGDVLLGLGGSEIEGFEDLRARIGRVQVGSKISVRVLREGEVKTLELHFEAPAAPKPPSVRPPRPARPFGGLGLPGMGGFDTLFQAGDIRDDVRESLEVLRGLPPSEELSRAITKLESARAKLDRIVEAVDGFKRMAESFMGGFEDMGGELPPIPDLSEFQERVQDLMRDGVDVEKLRRILAEEFPGIDLDLGRIERAPEAPKKKDEKDHDHEHNHPHNHERGKEKH